MELLFADDHALLRQGLVMLLGESHPDWTFHEAGTLDEALAVLAKERIDLLLLDLDMPGMDHTASVHALRETYPNVRVAVLTANEDRGVILDCLAAGAHGYILKSDAADQLVLAVGSVLAGQVYVTPALSRIVGATPAPTPKTALTAPQLAEFTPRQLDVLRLLAEGRSTKEIARGLNLGIGTVKVHLAGVYRALGAHNRMEAVLLAGKVKLPA